MNRSNSKYVFDKSRIVSRLFQISVALWFLRMVLPGVKYLFLPALLALFVSVLFSLKGDLFKKEYFFEFLKTFNPLIFLGVFFCAGLFLSETWYIKPIRDLVEYSINLFFLVIFFVLTYYSRSDEGFFWVFKKMSRVIWVTSIFVAVIGISKHLLQVYGYQLSYGTPWGTAINDDKNFYALYSFLGLVGLYPRIAKNGTGKQQLTSFLLSSILVINIIFSYSTRSIFLLAILLLVLIIVQVKALVKKHKPKVKVLAKNLRLTTFLLLLFTLWVVFMLKTDKPLANSWLQNYFGSQVTLKSFQLHTVSESVYQFEKWEYALDYFKQQSTLKKIFGGGFDYLEAFGQKFYGDKQHLDYPHNPVLSGLLYSGMLGAVFILFFLFVSFYYSVLYFKNHPLFSMMLFVCTLFIFFSGNSLFSVPIFLFLFSLSFLVRHQEISELKLVPNLSKPGSKFIKEIFDYLLASVALVVLSPLLFFITFMVGFTMGWPVVYTQKRIGQNGKPFKLHKFRSMKQASKKSSYNSTSRMISFLRWFNPAIKENNIRINKVKSDTTVAAKEQQRITRFGKILRKYKLDELPELWNIIRGDMSFVGPRPDVPGYADVLKGDDRIILQLKPGLTGAASLKYIHEEELLANQENPQKYNDEVIFPDKVLVNRKYMEKWSLWLDLKIIGYTGIGKSMHEDKFL